MNIENSKNNRKMERVKQEKYRGTQRKKVKNGMREGQKGKEKEKQKEGRR